MACTDVAAVIARGITEHERTCPDVAQEAAGHPLDTVQRLRLDHGAIAAAAIIATLQAILDRHNAVEEARTGCTPPAT
jgi:hypothetical protein